MTNSSFLVSSLPFWLHEAGVVKIDTKVGFRLKHHDTNPTAPLSPIYLNLRTPENPKPGPLTPELVVTIGRMLWLEAKARKIQFDAICGLPNAGTPLAKAFAQAAYDDGLLVPNVILGKTEVDSKRKIEGLVDTDGALRGDVVLVIDDLITRGNSKFEGIDALRNEGLKVQDVLVLVDREQGGKADLEERGIRLWRITTLLKVVQKLFEIKKVSAEDRDIVLKYLAA